MIFTIMKKWKIAGSYTYYLYTSPDLEDQSLPLLKASLSRYILPKDKGQIILSVFDALEENKGLSRNVTTNYIEEILSNSIGRYFMLSFVYNVRGAGQDASGGMRVAPPMPQPPKAASLGFQPCCSVSCWPRSQRTIGSTTCREPGRPVQGFGPPPRRMAMGVSS